MFLFSDPGSANGFLMTALAFAISLYSSIIDKSTYALKLFIHISLKSSFSKQTTNISILKRACYLSFIFKQYPSPNFSKASIPACLMPLTSKYPSAQSFRLNSSIILIVIPLLAFKKYILL